MKVIILGLIFAIIIVLCLISLKKYKETFNDIKNLNGINSFDKYFYINLDHRTDRKKQILQQLNSIGINSNKIERISAVREKYNGHLGVAQSHIKCLKKAKDENLNSIVIFEDDFVFTENKDTINTNINYFLKNFKKWDVVMFTTINTNKKTLNNPFIKKIVSATSPTAYAIHKNFYDTLLNDINKSVDKMKIEMIEFNKKNNGVLKKKHETRYAFDQHWFPLQKKSNWFIFEPYFGKDSFFGGSSIMGGIEAFKNNVNYYKILI